MFQSHFGLILTSRITGGAPGKHSFQSHFGLILTDEQGFYLIINKEFQSHFGLILTRGDTNENEDDRSFNPILV